MSLPIYYPQVSQSHLLTSLVSETEEASFQQASISSSPREPDASSQYDPSQTIEASNRLSSIENFHLHKLYLLKDENLLIALGPFAIYICQLYPFVVYSYLTLQNQSSTLFGHYLTLFWHPSIHRHFVIQSSGGYFHYFQIVKNEATKPFNCQLPNGYEFLINRKIDSDYAIELLNVLSVPLPTPWLALPIPRSLDVLLLKNPNQQSNEKSDLSSDHPAAPPLSIEASEVFILRDFWSQLKQSIRSLSFLDPEPLHLKVSALLNDPEDKIDKLTPVDHPSQFCMMALTEKGIACLLSFEADFRNLQMMVVLTKAYEELIRTTRVLAFFYAQTYDLFIIVTPFDVLGFYIPQADRGFRGMEAFQSPTLQFHYRLSDPNDQFEGSFALSTDHFTFSLVVCGTKNFHRILLLNIYGHYLYAWPIHVGQGKGEAIELLWSPYDFSLLALRSEIQKPLSYLHIFRMSKIIYKHEKEPLLLSLESVSHCQPVRTKLPEEIQAPSHYWSKILIHSEYSIGASPVTRISGRSLKRTFAVAGRCGFALYSQTSLKWRLFSSLAEEEDLVVIADMVWLGQYLVIPCLYKHETQIRMYHGDLKLDHRSTVACMRQTHRPLLVLKVSEDQLMIYDDHNQIIHYTLRHVQENDLTKVELIIDHKTCFASVIQNPSQVTHIVALVHPIRPSHLDEELAPMATRSLLSYLIQSSGYIIHYFPSLEISIPLCSESLHFQVETFEHLDILFVFTRNALKIWVDLFGTFQTVQELEQAVDSGRPEDVMVPIEDTLPVILDFSSGILVGMSTVSNESGLLELKRELFIPHLLKRLIGLEKCDLAERLCRSLYQSKDYFPFALEVLLYRVICISSQKELLSRTIAFLKRFSEYLEVVIAVARKTDSSKWEYLFSFAGDPMVLFENCMEQGRLRTAVSYLIVLCSLRSYHFSKESSGIQSLLSKLLAANETILFQEVHRYLASFSNS